jgi:hypothetical protein
VVLIPIFPLLAVAYWLLLRGRTGVLAWIGRVAAVCYIGFYGALDALAGIGTGTVMLRSGAHGADERPEIGWLFDAGNTMLAMALGFGLLAVGRDQPAAPAAAA